MNAFLRQTQHWIRTLFSVTGLVLFVTGTALGGKPEISLNLSAQTPRLYLVEKDPGTAWRTLAQIRQSMGDRVTVTSLFELGSDSYRYGNTFRLHSLVGDLNFKSYRIRAGRIPFWNPLNPIRVDGLELKVSSGFGTLIFLGGNQAKIDIQSDGGESTSHWLVSWAGGNKPWNLELSTWGKKSGDSVSTFIGANIRTRFAGFRFHGLLAWDLGNKRPNYTRVRLSRRVANHSVYVGIRQRRMSGIQSYSWVNKPFNLSPTAYVGTTTQLSSGWTLWNQVSVKVQETANWVYRSTIQVKQLSLTVLGGKKDDDTLLGVVSTIQAQPWKKITCGGSLSYQALDHGDVVDLEQASGLYSWINWQPRKSLRLQLISRYSTNPFYEIDGRIGFNVQMDL